MPSEYISYSNTLLLYITRKLDEFFISLKIFAEVGSITFGQLRLGIHH